MQENEAKTKKCPRPNCGKENAIKKKRCAHCGVLFPAETAQVEEPKGEEKDSHKETEAKTVSEPGSRSPKEPEQSSDTVSSKEPESRSSKEPQKKLRSPEDINRQIMAIQTDKSPAEKWRFRTKVALLLPPLALPLYLDKILAFIKTIPVILAPAVFLGILVIGVTAMFWKWKGKELGEELYSTADRFYRSSMTMYGDPVMKQSKSYMEYELDSASAEDRR